MPRESFPPIDDPAQIERDILANQLIEARMNAPLPPTLAPPVIETRPEPVSRVIAAESMSQDEIDSNRIAAMARTPFIRAPKLTGDELTDDINYSRLSTARITLSQPSSITETPVYGPRRASGEVSDVDIPAPRRATAETPVVPDVATEATKIANPAAEVLPPVEAEPDPDNDPEPAPAGGETRSDARIYDFASKLLRQRITERQKLHSLRRDVAKLHAASGESDSQDIIDAEVIEQETGTVEESTAASDGLAVVIELRRKHPHLVEDLRRQLELTDGSAVELADRLVASA